LAKENFSSSPWSSQLQVFHTAAQDYCPEQKYDIVVCAPPYFVNSTLSGCKEIDVARHKLTLTFSDIVQFADKYLE
jgi:tRNA1Val (adenine37-N6)-methyltransferase